MALEVPGESPALLPPTALDGSPLQGRVILLHAEQGLGDALQFIRYAAPGPGPRRPGDRGLGGSARPAPGELPGHRPRGGVGDPLPHFDVYAPLLSLPRLLGTTLATVPAMVPYLAAAADLVAQRRREFARLPGFRLGIAWQGNPRYRQDGLRSFRLEQLEPLAGIAGVRLVSLQVGPGSEQLGERAGRFTVAEPDGGPADLMDTAGLLQNLDLVVAPDTAVAHLAGALGVPAWVALPVAADWRWLVERSDSPWYPTLRLFRQARWGDWGAVFERMAGAAAARLGAEGDDPGPRGRVRR